MSKQLKIIFILFFISITSVLISFSSAYLTDTHNIIKDVNIGYVKIEILESGSYPQNIGSLTAECSYSPRFKNNGNVDVYLRVSMDLSDDQLFDYISFTNLGQNGGWEDSYNRVEGSLYGYYYYTEVLGVGESTTPLFNNIIPDGSIPEEFQGSVLNMYAEAIAVENNSDYGNAWETYLELQ